MLNFEKSQYLRGKVENLNVVFHVVFYVVKYVVEMSCQYVLYYV
jgi:hypothetical protein